jgi:hypothetical protein
MACRFLYIHKNSPQKDSLPLPGAVIFSKAVHFPYSKISRFPSKYAFWRQVALIGTANIVNIHGAILIFREFFGSDPLPTREK